MPPKERLNVRIARIYLEWKDYRDYNASFAEPYPTWHEYKIDGLVQAGCMCGEGQDGPCHSQPTQALASTPTQTCRSFEEEARSLVRMVSVVMRSP